MSALPVPDQAPRRATAHDAAGITALLVDAFAEDLMWGSSWAFPDPSTRRAQRTALFRILVDGALRFPWVWVSGGLEAASLWIPPGGSELSERQEQALTAMLEASSSQSLDRITAGFKLIEEARPSTEHYYLTLLGSAPSLAGLGFGVSLLRHTLSLIDAVGAPAYLETSTALVPFYERFGFNVRSSFRLPDGPSVNTMWRPEQTR